MLIDASYFYGDLLIAQLSQPAVLATLNRFISQYEQKYLQEMLGFAMYQDFKANPTDQRWTDFLNGAEYTNQYGNLAKWEGLKREVLTPIVYDAGPPEVLAVPGMYQSPIANYVYYWYLRHNATTTAGSGEVLNNVNTPASPADKMVRAWNQMVEWNRELYGFFYSNNMVYPIEYENYSLAGYYRQGLGLFTPINPLGF